MKLHVTDSTSSMSESESTSDKHEAGLDVELAKALKVFFKDVRSIQQQLRQIKQFSELKK